MDPSSWSTQCLSHANEDKKKPGRGLAFGFLKSTRAHPNHFELVSCLKKEQGTTEALFRDSELGANSALNKKRKYALLDELITNLAHEYDNNVIDDATYVRRLSKLVHQF